MGIYGYPNIVGNGFGIFIKTLNGFGMVWFLIIKMVMVLVFYFSRIPAPLPSLIFLINICSSHEWENLVLQFFVNICVENYNYFHKNKILAFQSLNVYVCLCVSSISKHFMNIETLGHVRFYCPNFKFFFSKNKLCLFLFSVSN